MGDVTDMVQAVNPMKFTRNKPMIVGAGVAALVGIYLFMRNRNKEVVTVGNPQAPSESAVALAQDYAIKSQEINSAQSVALASMDTDRYMADLAARMQAENNDAYLSGMELQTSTALASQVSGQDYNIRMAYDQLVWGQKALETAERVTNAELASAERTRYRELDKDAALGSYALFIQHDLGKKRAKASEIGAWGSALTGLFGK